MHGKSNVSDTNHGSAEYQLDASEINQKFLNLTAEVENLKKETDIIREDKHLLQNRVFFLEEELKQKVQILSTIEQFDKNLTYRLNETAKKLENLEVKMRYTSLSLLDIQSMTEKLNGSLVKYIEDKLNITDEKLT
ncbi:uncharacterized protein LOC134265153, partial [Saccostrea cucullata]|uniref:uncharacterized protein LOC134265153 n=1 Tax=Saccostrea cuccullata TaxID=36930 RepID=UPI002ED37EA8